MFGAITGDIIGSVYESSPIKSRDFNLFSNGCRFTDDSVLTAATGWAILECCEYGKAYKEFARSFPDAGYGANFSRWFVSDSDQPYGSWGNGSAMRVSPIGWAFESEEEVLTQARKSSEVTHNHPEGIKGAQAVAIAVWLGTKGESKNRIRDKIENYFDYDLSSSVEEIRKNYSFDVSCQGTVPQAIVCFLESEDFEGAVRNAVSLGGDSDTLGCITGSIAEAYYKHIPSEIIEQVKIKLPQRFLDIIKKFYRKYQQ